MIIATGVGGLHTLEENQRLPRRRARPRQPVLRPDDDAERHRRRRRDAVRLDGPNLCIATACAARAPRHRRGRPPDPRRHRRRRDGRRHRGAAHARSPSPRSPAWARSAPATTTPSVRPPVRRRPRRLRDGEGAGVVMLERWSGRSPAAPVSTARSPATAATPTPTTSPRRHPVAPARRRACSSHSTTPGSLPSDIGHVNAHGTSTPLNDAAEAEAVRKVFGDGAAGHLDQGRDRSPDRCRGAVEAVAACCLHRPASIPPTANLEQLGDDIEPRRRGGPPREVGIARRRSRTRSGSAATTRALILHRRRLSAAP